MCSQPRFLCNAVLHQRLFQTFFYLSAVPTRNAVLFFFFVVDVVNRLCMGEGGAQAFSSPNGFLKKGVVSLEEAAPSPPVLLTCRLSTKTPGEQSATLV